MRSIAMVICAALFGLNAEAAFLHVHEREGTGHHDHGPATHLHRKVHVSPAHSTVAALDEDSTSVPAVLAKATTPHTYEVMIAAVAVVTVRDRDSSQVPLATVVSRAHGPPDSRPCSLRAPPRLFLL